MCIARVTTPSPATWNSGRQASHPTSAPTPSAVAVAKAAYSTAAWVMHHALGRSGRSRCRDDDGIARFHRASTVEASSFPVDVDDQSWAPASAGRAVGAANGARRSRGSTASPRSHERATASTKPGPPSRSSATRSAIPQVCPDTFAGVTAVEIAVHIVAGLVGRGSSDRSCSRRSERSPYLGASASRSTTFVFIAGRKVIRPFVDRSSEERRERILQRLRPDRADLPRLHLGGARLPRVHGIYWSFGGLSWLDAFLLSGSSLTTLGVFSTGDAEMAVGILEAIIGLGLVGLLITFLPTIYGEYNRRELAVAQLSGRAGSPPSAERLIIRLSTIRGLEEVTDMWEEWERFFAELEESHQSYPSLMYFRSGPDRSWLTASGAVLDAASLVTAAVDVPRQPSAQLCIRSGFLALRSLAEYLRLPVDHDPDPGDSISISREEFDQACDSLAAAGVPLIDDRDEAWRGFAGWRVNYDSALIGLCGIVQPPVAPWSSDRAVRYAQPLFRTVWAVRMANR